VLKLKRDIGAIARTLGCKNVRLRKRGRFGLQHLERERGARKVKRTLAVRGSYTLEKGCSLTKQRWPYEEEVKAKGRVRGLRERLRGRT